MTSCSPGTVPDWAALSASDKLDVIDCIAINRPYAFHLCVRLYRAAPLVRVKTKITVKNAVCEESSATAYGDFDCEFDFDSHEWSCAHGTRNTQTHCDMTRGTAPRAMAGILSKART